MTVTPLLVRLPRATGSTPCPEGCRGLHSYTARQERWCWRPRAGGNHAFDVELSDREPPELVVRHLQVTPGEDFWQGWTRLEVVAKLTDTPVLSLLRMNPEDAALPDGFRAWHVRYGENVFCFATSRSR